jgi:membrane protease YdiL (CAAX protease family)
MFRTTAADTDDTATYWEEARRPLASLVFLAPLLVAYEAGVLWIGGSDPGLLQGGADHWMRIWLGQLGLGPYLLLPALVVAVLVGWHMASGRPTRVSGDTLAGMVAESLLFAFLLVVLGQLQDVVFQRLAPPPTLSVAAQSTARLLSFLGAGIYEEVLFRLGLLPLFYVLFRASQLSSAWSAVLAIVSTSLAFSLAHFVGPAGDPFTLFSFTFRAIAGAFFAGLFWLRGFGITVGAHATYDVLVGILLQVQD